MLNRMRAIVVTFECLPLRLLGCYGSEWVESWAFDRLATEAVTFDQHFATGLANAWPQEFASLQDAGVAVQVLAEANPAFDESGSVEIVSGETGFDADPRSVPFAKLVDRARELLPSWSSSGEAACLWLHSDGVPSPCLTPLEYAKVYLEQLDDELDEETAADDGFAAEPDQPSDDDDASEGVEIESLAQLPTSELARIADAVATLRRAGGVNPPRTLFDATRRSATLESERVDAVNSSGPDSPHSPQNITPIEWKIARCLYAGYVTLLDRWLGELLDAIAERAPDALLIVAARSGAVLRQQPHTLPHRTGLSDDLIHTPLFIRLPDSIGGTRRQALAQTHDLVPTLREWFGLPATAANGGSLLPVVRNDSEILRERIIVHGDDDAAGIRTADYYLVTESAVSENASRMLFLKPEDRWEMNDVVSQYPVQADELAAALRESLASDHA